MKTLKGQMVFRYHGPRKSGADLEALNRQMLEMRAMMNFQREEEAMFECWQPQDQIRFDPLYSWNVQNGGTYHNQDVQPDVSCKFSEF